VKNKIIEKVCMICSERFVPDPRVGDRQKVCKKLSCKLHRKKLAQQHWLLKNPGYFQGRYPQLKDQIMANKQRRSQINSGAGSGIQDKLTFSHNNLLTTLISIMSIQDEITNKIIESKHYLSNSLRLVYKTS